MITNHRFDETVHIAEIQDEIDERIWVAKKLWMEPVLEKMRRKNDKKRKLV